MFEISQEDRDVMNMVRENRRRSEITTTIGYIATQEQAMEYAAIKAAQKHRCGGWQGIALLGIYTLVAIGLAVAALV